MKVESLKFYRVINKSIYHLNQSIAFKYGSIFNFEVLKLTCLVETLILQKLTNAVRHTRTHSLQGQSQRPFLHSVRKNSWIFQQRFYKNFEQCKGLNLCFVWIPGCDGGDQKCNVDQVQKEFLSNMMHMSNMKCLSNMMHMSNMKRLSNMIYMSNMMCMSNMMYMSNMMNMSNMMYTVQYMSNMMLLSNMMHLSN